MKITDHIIDVNDSYIRAGFMKPYVVTKDYHYDDEDSRQEAIKKAIAGMPALTDTYHLGITRDHNNKELYCIPGLSIKFNMSSSTSTYKDMYRFCIGINVKEVRTYRRPRTEEELKTVWKMLTEKLAKHRGFGSVPSIWVCPSLEYIEKIRQESMKKMHRVEHLNFDYTSTDKYKYPCPS